MAEYLGIEPYEGAGYVFISYNSQDADRLKPIIQSLGRSGIRIWYDIGIDYSTNWQKVIAEHIKNSDAVVMFVTKGVIRKGENSYVYKEYRIANEAYKKKVIIVYLDMICVEDVPESLQFWWTDLQMRQSIEGLRYHSSDKLAEEIRKAVKWDEIYSKYVTVAAEETDKDNITSENPELVEITDDSAKKKKWLNYSLLVAGIAAFTGVGFLGGKLNVGQKDSNSSQIVSQEMEKQEPVTYADVQVGETIVFGKYEQDNNLTNGAEDIEWIVLYVDEENHQVLMISDMVLDAKPYNKENANIAWADCTLRGWLNGTDEDSFYGGAFTDAEKASIIEVKVETDGESAIIDNVFLLSQSEVYHYFDEDANPKGLPSPYAIAQGACESDLYTSDGKATCWWWLRSNDSKTSAMRMFSSGIIDERNISTDDGGVRPALWVDLANLVS